jgi:UDP-glucose 4-epimerase
MKILLTGGAGYIGSHTAISTVAAGHEVEILDNFANSSPIAVERASALCGTNITTHQVDLLDADAVNVVMARGFDAVIHFAGLKAVAESVEHPLDYYHINITATINLCRAMLRYSVHNLVFSSSATVYGDVQQVPIDESFAVADATNPYGRSKLFIERILEDVGIANPHLNIARLRYFNPAGAHESGSIGEDPTGIPANLVPYLCQFAVGRQNKLVVFGDDYSTADGTCIRDYIHVSDLADGHVVALNKLMTNPGLVTYNLGSGTGTSVLEMIQTFEAANNLQLDYQMGERRAGDVPRTFTDPTKAEQELGWRARKSVFDICQDAFRWQRHNPQGYK